MTASTSPRASRPAAAPSPTSVNGIPASASSQATSRAPASQGRVSATTMLTSRPWLAGARLVAWELALAGIPFTLVGDGAAAGLLARGEVDAVIVGPEAIARNGDVACDPGSYGLAVVAERHAIPFLVAAPVSTYDREAADGRLAVVR